MLQQPKNMNCIALQYNIGLKDQPVRENVAFPDRSTALCLLCDCTTSNAAGFPRYMGLNRLFRSADEAVVVSLV